MSGMTSANIITAARVNLQEAVASRYSDANLSSWLSQVVREIARKSPLRKRANLAIVEYTKEVDLSSLAYIDDIAVEYPVGNGTNKPVFRGYQQYGSSIALDLQATPTITDGTLTGTVTFTQNSRTVTGSGTAFATELSDGDLICKGKVADAAYKWYQIAKVVDATTLTLVEPFEESSGDDTVSLTKYRDSYSCVRVYYGGEYTVSTTSDMPAKYDEIAILGVVAHAASDYAGDYLADTMVDVTSKISSAATAVGNASARITQAVTDLGTVRVDIEADLTSFAGALADVETDLDQANTDLTSGRAVIDSVNTGGDVTGGYGNYAQIEIMNARQRLEKARSYLESAKTSKDYVDYATIELNAANQYVNQATGYIGLITQEINSGILVSAFHRWAQLRWSEYQKALNNIGYVKVKPIVARS